MDEKKPLSADEKIEEITNICGEMKKKGQLFLWDNMHPTKNYEYFEYQSEIMEILQNDICNFEKIHQEHLDQQIKDAKTLLENDPNIALLPNKFEHTIRDALYFHSDKASARYQLTFSSDIEKYPIYVAKHNDENCEQRIIHGGVYDWMKIPEELIYAFVDSLPSQEMTIPGPCLMPGKIHLLRIYLMKHPHYIEGFKAYLADGKPLEYGEQGTPTEQNPDGIIARKTPRVLVLPDGKILLSQHSDHYYSEKHLKKYRGTHFFFKVFASHDAYLAYEKKTIQTLQEPINRFVLLKSWMTSELWDKNDDGLLRQELKTAHKRWQGTIQEIATHFLGYQSTADFKIIDLLRNMSDSNHPGHIKEWYQLLQKTLEERSSKVVEMSTAITNQTQNSHPSTTKNPERI